MKTNEEQYFHDIFDLLKKYEYVHSLRNIDFFLQDQWKKLPNDWLLFLNDLTRDELNQLPRNGHSHPKCPETLKSFLIECGRLSVLIDEPLSMQPLPNTICKSVKQKKRHELNHLTLFIVSLCDQLNCNRVVDIGCGLGHLLRAIGNQRPLKLVGIDSDAACCSKASTSFDVHSGSEFRSKTITANATKQQLDEMLLGNESDRTAIVSLHGCGELQPTILKWFAEADRVKAPLLIAVACCYHKMSSGKDGTSINFPLSSCCSTALDTFRVSPSSLRLACQETAIRWESQSHEDHDKHERSFVHASLLQLFFANKGLDPLSLQPRHRRKIMSSCSFEAFVEAILASFELSDAVKAEWSEELNKLWTSLSDYTFAVEPFTALQVALQAPLESLLLSDRLAFLKEHGLNASLTPVFNAAISPRNMAIVAHEFL